MQVARAFLRKWCGDNSTGLHLVQLLGQLDLYPIYVGSCDML